MADEPSNLTMRRAGPSVWDKQAAANARCRAMELLGFMMIAGGVCLVAQGYYRKQFGAGVKGRIKSMLDDRRGGDQVMKASEESFPASDPPAWTPAVGKPAHAEPSM